MSAANVDLSYAEILGIHQYWEDLIAIFFDFFFHQNVRLSEVRYRTVMTQYFPSFFIKMLG